MQTDDSTRGRDRNRNSTSTARGGVQYDRRHNYPSDGSLLSANLQDWLKLTGWHNSNYRYEKLTSYRIAQLDKISSGDNNSTLALKMKQYSPSASAIENNGAGRRDDSSNRDHATFLRGRSSSPVRNEGYDYRSRDYAQQHGIDEYEDRHGTPMKKRETQTSDYHTSHEDRRDVQKERTMAMYPKQLAFGEHDDVIFFVFRSYSWNNVYDCMEDGLWATQAANEQMLSTAFTSTKTVVLFFSVNGSRGIQGYAVMKSPPSGSTTRPRWWYDIKWEISEPFKVEWLCKTHVDNTCIRHITNSLHENLPVTRARDGQQIETEAGKQMLTIIESHAIQHAKRAMRPGSSMA
ncbi:YTH-domain-containing protein [Hypoxylon rubiginosum]|uniref:YTH-domain-containing protein n=1 Tax=Hypoxylon rubiginosum TaxID=110542 RepID=A0ACB9YNF2_9PEZI|nr:YTH-domain-containing protein [Hypoxylon rubiginosum]